MDGIFNLFAGWMIDGTGGPARESVLVRVERGMISSVEGRRGGAPPGSAHPLLDFSDCTIIPGLIDSHVHLPFSGTVDPDARKEQFGHTFEQRSHLMDQRIDRYISCGILALRDGGDRDGHGLRYRIERVKAETFFRFRAPGAGWRAKGRYGKFIANRPGEAVSLGECIFRRNIPADHIKIINSGLNSLTEFGKLTPPQFSREELKTAIEAAHVRGLKTMVHANGHLPVADAVEAGCASIEHGFFMGRENMERMAEHRVFWVPTVYSMKAFLLHMPPGIEARTAAKNLDHQLEQIAAARRLGVRVVLGTDAGGYGLRHGESFVEEFRLLVEAGFSIEEAIRCASGEGASLLGLQDEPGQLKAGMPATFVAVPGGPSRLPDSLLGIRSVYVRGVEVR